MKTMAASGGKAAFEIVKGERQILTLSEADVERYIDPKALLDALEHGFSALDQGDVQSPHRPELAAPGKGYSLAMPAWTPGMQMCVKIVNVFDGNLALDMPNHLAIINLFDPDTGLVTCVMDGTFITGIRTAASAVLSARLLAREDSRVATIVGAGVQGREHLRLLPLIRDFDEILICSLNHEDARRLAARDRRARAVESIEEAVRASDIVCLATHSPEPVIDHSWIRPGTHVSSVGFFPPRGELPFALAREQRLFVETVDAFEVPPVGCSELAGLDRDRATMLGAVINGRAPGRESADQITVYKAMGIAMEDLVAANLAYASALRVGHASRMEW